MKLIATVSNREEAGVLVSLLESNGIQSFQRDEITIATDQLLTNALGGIKIEVHEEDYDDVIELLKAIHWNDKETIRSENRNRPQLSRYIKIALISGTGCLFIILFKRPPSELSDLGAPLLASGIVGGAIGAIFGLLDK